MDQKRKLLGNFEKIFTFFDENSIEKWNFFIFIFIGKFVTKNRAFGNSNSFLQQFFRFFFGGGGFPPFPPAYALVSHQNYRLPELLPAYQKLYRRTYIINISHFESARQYRRFINTNFSYFEINLHYSTKYDGCIIAEGHLHNETQMQQDDYLS